MGGPIQTPNFQKLADTGRNHHSVHTGVITEMATGYPASEFEMTIRTYWPKPEVNEGKWSPPAVTHAK